MANEPPADDKKAPKQQISQPGSMPTDQAIRDLLVDQSIRFGGQRTNIAGQSLSAHAPIWPKIENGVLAITYSFDQAHYAENFRHDGVSDIMPLCDEHQERALIAQSLKDYERVANVKFRPAAENEKPDIVYLTGKITTERMRGTTYSSISPKIVVFRDGEPLTKSVVLHETGHALGLAHPATKLSATEGNNQNYSQLDTVMSYNNVSLNGKALPAGIGKHDVPPLQLLYDKPSLDAAPSTITDKILTDDNHVIYSSKPVTLNLRDVDRIGGGLVIDMDKSVQGQIGYTGDAKTNQVYALTTDDTRLQNVLASIKTQISLDIRGGSLPNLIQGGAWPDRLIPIGGNDVLVGGGGANRFVLLRESGFNNIISDFKSAGPDKDKIQIAPDLADVQTIYREDFPYNGHKVKGTEVIGVDKDGKKLASLFVLNTSRDAVENALFNIDNFDLPFDRPAPQHPSGLPNNVINPGIPGQQPKKR